MSRCFPFPPPGYAGKCSGNDALIVSIKLQKELENAKQQKPKLMDRNKDKSSDRKKDKSLDKKKEDRKKEKKEKKDRKDKKRDRSAVDSGKQKHVDTLYKAVDGCLEDFKGKQTLPKQEVLEQSNLTEEHGRPVESQNVSCSSDSTGNSGKRKRLSLPPSSIQGNGNIIRIRLSSQKRDEPSTSGGIPSLKSEDHSPTLARTESSISHKHEMLTVQEPIRPVMTMSTASLQLVWGEDKDPRTHQQRATASMPPREVPTTSGKTETREPSKKLSRHEKKMLKRESLCSNLFQNFVPPTLNDDLMVDQDDDEEWLFAKKDAERPAKRLRGSDDLQASHDNLSCSTSAVLQPRAHYLSDIGVYALPFTVPF